MHYDDDSCSMWGQFGEGKAQVAMRMTRYQPGSATELALYGKRFASGAQYSDVETDFKSDGTSSKGRGIHGKSDKLPLMLLGMRDLSDRPDRHDLEWSSLSSLEQDTIADVTIRIGNETPLRLPLSPAAGVWGALRTCTDNLVRRWGFDPAEQASLSRAATPLDSPRKWLRSDDYPTGAILGGQIGVVHFRLEVAADGSVSACHVQMESKPHDFSAATCAALSRRARFAPALDRHGQAVRSYYVNGVNWLLQRY